jgi:hypothetical protein
VLLQPGRDVQAVQQLLHPRLIIGVQAQALLVVLGGTLKLLPTLKGQAQVEVNVLPLGLRSRPARKNPPLLGKSPLCGNARVTPRPRW